MVVIIQTKASSGCLRNVTQQTPDGPASEQQHSTCNACSSSFVPVTTELGHTVEDCKTEDDAHDEGQANLFCEFGTEISDDCVQAIGPLSVHEDPMSQLRVLGKTGDRTLDILYAGPCAGCEISDRQQSGLLAWHNSCPICTPALTSLQTSASPRQQRGLTS